MSGRNGRYFLDTNILVYTFDPRDPAKQTKANALVEDALNGQQGLISYQVVQEFLNVATRKFARSLTFEDSRLYLDRVLLPLCEVFPSPDFYRQAMVVAERWRYSLYDSLILTAALRGGCRRLYSEDLQHGQEIEGLMILDPFKDIAEA